MTPSRSLRSTSLRRAAATAGPAILVLLFGALVLWAGGRAQQSARAIGTTHRVIEAVERTLSALRDAETGQRGYLLTGEGGYLEPYRAALQRLDGDLAALRRLTAERPVQQARLDTLAELASAKRAELAETVQLRRSGDAAAALAVVRTDRGKRLMDRLRGVAAGMERAEEQRLAEQEAADRRLRPLLLWTVIGGALVAAAAALWVNLLLGRYARARETLVRELGASNEQLQEQGMELEMQATELQAQAAELEMANDELRRGNEELLRLGVELDSAREVAEREQDRLREVFAYAPSVMAIYSGPEHRITLVNETWEQTVGKPGVVGRPFREVFPEFRDTDLFEQLDRVYRTGEPFRDPEVHVPLERWGSGEMEDTVWNLAWLPLRGRDGVVSDILVHAVEVTEQVQARTRVEALRAQAEAGLAELEAVVDRMNEGLVVADAGGNLVRWNPQALRMHGLTDPAEGLGPLARFGDIFQLATPDGDPVPLERWPLARAIGGETFSGWELRVHRVDADWERILLYGGTPVRAADDQPTLALITVRDVTGERAAEAALRRAKAEAEQANRAKSEFLAAMSHELRTPLNAIAGYTELMDLGIHGPVTPKQRKALERIRANEKLLLTLINDILNYAKLEAGRIEFQPRELPLSELLRGMEALVEPQVRGKRLDYAVEPCDGPAVAWADEERVQQILLNLIGNAIKFTEPGGWIRIACGVDGGGVEIRVSDCGRGIPPERLESIFEPFVQLDRHSTDASQQGVGLGLAISRDLARAMGGDLFARSKPGRGSTFVLTLPSADAEPAAQGADAKRRESGDRRSDEDRRSGQDRRDAGQASGS